MTRVRLGRKLWKVESAKPKALCDCKGKCKKHHMGECDYENQAIRVRDKQGDVAPDRSVDASVSCVQ